jgi:anti-anti-sigma factor
MEITTQSQSDGHELRLNGRLDANWADLVDQTIEAAIRSGHHQVTLEFSQVSYVSSAGIRVLLKHYKQLKAAKGHLRVVRPTDSVFSVLKLSGIASMLVQGLQNAVAPVVAAVAAAAPASVVEPVVKRWSREGVEFEAHELGPIRPLDATLIGNPAGLSQGTFRTSDIRPIRCGADTLMVGLGGFGNGPGDVVGRLGESLAAAGTVISLPTDGSSVPDYQVSEAQLVPEIQLQYGIGIRGTPSRLFRFEAGRSGRGVVGLSQVVEAILDSTGWSAAGFAFLAESACVIGASLQRSPAADQDPLAFPGIRDWISFTTERSDERHGLLIVGMAVRNPRTEGAAWFRPIGSGTTAQGHFHAAVFPYRPLPKGRLELVDTVQGWVSNAAAQTVLHLVADERPFEGVGQTDLMRGACWAGPIEGSGEIQRNS